MSCVCRPRCWSTYCPFLETSRQLCYSLSQDQRPHSTSCQRRSFCPSALSQACPSFQASQPQHLDIVGTVSFFLTVLHSSHLVFLYRTPSSYAHSFSHARSQKAIPLQSQRACLWWHDPVFHSFSTPNTAITQGPFAVSGTPVCSWPAIIIGNHHSQS